MSAAAAPVIALKSRKVHPTRFREATGHRNHWAAVPEHGVAYEDVLSPEYWAHIAPKLRNGDLIEVTAEDGSYFALLFVVAVQRQAAGVVELFKKDLNAVAMPDMPSGIEVVWKGPMLKWAVMRTKDKVVVSDKHDSRPLAEIAAADYLKVLAR